MFTYTIGLEIHVQLKTKSKMFCRCSNDGENQPPNTTVCPVCMGHPGTLPVMNEEAIRWGVKTSRALNCTINEISKFDRKNYFYPDLPKGYQISQYDKPIGIKGYVYIVIPDGKIRKEARIGITRLHMEEDAAKLLHAPGSGASLVDFNRSSTPLMEIVTEPDFVDPMEAKIFLQDLRLLARYLNVSHADMEKGHMRCDANVSINVTGDDGIVTQSPISEIKNLNSFRSVERALEYEGNRLYEEWMANGEVRNRTYKITVGWDDAKQETILQRWKEEAHDYRYFPEPDLPPLHFTNEYITQAESEIPELPNQKRERFGRDFGIAPEDARILIDDKETASFFENSASELDEWLCSMDSCDDAFKAKTYKLLAGWVINKLTNLLATREAPIEKSLVTPADMAKFVALISEDKINSTTAQKVLEAMVERGVDPLTMIQEEGLEQIQDTGLIESACRKALDNNPDAVANFKNGKQNALMFLVGQVMRDLKGQGNPEAVKQQLERLLTI